MYFLSVKIFFYPLFRIIYRLKLEGVPIGDSTDSEIKYKM